MRSDNRRFIKAHKTQDAKLNLAYQKRLEKEKKESQSK
jgi:uncharacterized protein YecT (DUF1311 family)